MERLGTVVGFQPSQVVEHALRGGALRLRNDVEERLYVFRCACHFIHERHIGKAPLAGEHSQLVARVQQLLEDGHGLPLAGIVYVVRKPTSALVGCVAADIVQFPGAWHDWHGALTRPGTQAADGRLARAVEQIKREFRHRVVPCTDILEECTAKDEDLVAQLDKALAFAWRQVDPALFKVAQEDERNGARLFREYIPHSWLRHCTAKRVVQPCVCVEHVHVVA